MMLPYCFDLSILLEFQRRICYFLKPQSQDLRHLIGRLFYNFPSLDIYKNHGTLEISRTSSIHQQAHSKRWGQYRAMTSSLSFGPGDHITCNYQASHVALWFHQKIVDPSLEKSWPKACSSNSYCTAPAKVLIKYF